MGIIIKPIVTEKMTAMGEKYNRYGFRVDRGKDTKLLVHLILSLLARQKNLL